MKAAVIGAGFWGSKVIKEYTALKNEGILDEVILCDIDSSRLKRFNNDVVTSTSIDETLQKVDMVHICTPNSTHFGLAQKALDLNINVLIEKPMAEDTAHAFDLVESSMSKGLILQVGHIFRFANIVRNIKQLVAAGELGDIYCINCAWTHLIAPVQNTDVIYDLLPHPLDILNFITGKWPTNFGGIGKVSRTQYNRIDIANLALTYEHFYANIHLSWVSLERKRQLEIVGSKKTVSADCVKQVGNVFDDSGPSSLMVDPNNTIRAEVMNFIESIKTGKNDFNSSVIGARTVDMINQAIKSITVV